MRKSSGDVATYKVMPKSSDEINKSLSKNRDALHRLQIGSRHYRVMFSDALDAHEASHEAFGGLEGISNIDNIHGALGRPYHGYHRTIWAKGAALLHGAASSHGFDDGNKRTSLAPYRTAVCA